MMALICKWVGLGPYTLSFNLSCIIGLGLMGWVWPPNSHVFGMYACLHLN